MRRVDDLKLAGVKMPRESSRRRACGEGFTLVEILVVMAVISVMAVVAAPALKGTFDSMNLTGATETVTDCLSFARQTSLTRNLAVEVRIYQYDSGSGLAWNTLGVLVPASVSGKANDEWLIAPKLLPGNICFDPGMSGSGDSFSTVVTSGTNPAPTAGNPNPRGPWAGTESAGAPGFVKNLGYVAFRFLPDGSTDLPAQDSSNSLSWCLSLKKSFVKSTGGAVPAANFVSLVIDPATGHTLAFRP